MKSLSFWVLLLFALSFCAFAVQSGDVLLYLAFARDFIISGQWHLTDPYLYSLNGAPLVWTHEWLSYVLFYGAWQALGPAGLIALKVVVLAAGFVLVLNSRPREHNRSSLWVLLWALAVLAASFRFIERSSLFSDLLTLILIERLLAWDSLNRNRALGLAALFALWVQMHPGFPLGLALLALWVAHRMWVTKTLTVRSLAWLFVPACALIANPTGIDGALYPFRFAMNEAQVFKRYNFEWFPSYHPAFRFAPETVAFWILAVVGLGLSARARAFKDLSLWFALLVFAMALQAVRFVPLAAWVVLLAAKPHVVFKSARLNSLVLQRGLLALMCMVALKNVVFGYHASSGDRLPSLSLDPKFFPIKTAEFARTQPIPGRMYNTHDLGAYLIWKVQTPIFHHGFVTDMDFYQNEVLGVFASKERFFELVRKYQWTMLLVEKHGAYKTFYRYLAPHPEWKIVAEDEASYLIYHLP